jgi:hypothetical protein
MDVDAFSRLGYRDVGRQGALSARLIAEGRPPIRLALRFTGGRVFGGTYALEIATDQPVLPRTRGLAARGRGIVKVSGITFRARRDDDEGRRLAERLTSDGALASALSKVHFEHVRVDPDGRAVIRHMGGSLVWLLFPPMSHPVPIVPEQVRATIAALEAFGLRGG